MSFLDNFQTNLDEIRNNLNIITKRLSQNTREIRDIAKIKLDIIKEKKNLNSLYKELGTHHYKLYKNLETTLNEDNQIVKIDISLARIKSLEDSIKSQGKDSIDSGTSGLYIMDNKKDNDD